MIPHPQKTSHPLSRKETHAYAKALKNLDVFENARDFILRAYGDRGHTLVIERIASELTRRDGMPLITMWQVLDRNKTPIEANLALCFWEKHLPVIHQALIERCLYGTVERILREEINRVLPAELAKYTLSSPLPPPFSEIDTDESSRAM